jgi:H+/gluconate symporter-like permease
MLKFRGGGVNYIILLWNVSNDLNTALGSSTCCIKIAFGSNIKQLITPTSIQMIQSLS